MRHTLGALAMGAALIALTACSDEPDVSANRAAPQSDAAPEPPPAPSVNEPPVVKPRLVTDPSATLPPAPGRASRWYARSTSPGPVAIFGPPNGEGSITVTCDRAHDALIFRRTTDEASSVRVVTLNLSLVGGASLVRAFSDGGDPPAYSGSMPLRDPWLDRLLAAKGTLETDLDGRAPLSVPVAGPLKQVVRACRASK